jgi:hypothetical protein
MSPIREVEKKYCSRALAAAILIALLAIAAGYREVGKGLVFGTLFSISNFILMGEMLLFRIGKSKKRTYLYSLLSLGLRCALLGVPLAAAIRFDRIDLISTVFGIFMVQLVILADHCYRLFNLDAAGKT